MEHNRSETSIIVFYYSYQPRQFQTGSSIKLRASSLFSLQPKRRLPVSCHFSRGQVKIQPLNRKYQTLWDLYIKLTALCWKVHKVKPLLW